MLKQPVGFKKLTNVALIRLKKGNGRFEIACYRNKVLDWRSGLEDQIEQVLQIEEIYSNAVSGDLCKKSEWEAAFPGMTKMEVIKAILDKGEMQVSDKEREQLLKNTRKELLLIVSSKVVHPDTNRLFPTETIEKAIEEMGFDVKLNEPAKKQANFLIKELSERYYLKRADMEIKLSLREEWVASADGPEGDANQKRLAELKSYLKSHSIEVKESKENGMLVFTCLVEAAKYKDISVDSKNFFAKSVCEITEHQKMRIDESENSTLQVRSEYFSGLKGKHGHGDHDEKPAKKANAKKDKPEEADEQVPTPKKGSKAKKAKAKKAAKAAQAAETSSEGESVEEDMDDSAYQQKPQAPKEVTAADRKKAKKLREKDSKRDPADLMDPHNIKPARAAGVDDDLKAQIAKFEFKCSACPFGTDTNEEFKSHFKSEWHKINLKRKVAEQEPLTEEQFKELVILKEFA